MEGFEWVNADDSSRSIYSFIRHSKGAKKNLLFVCNFTPIERPEYRVGVPRGKQYRLVLNSDELQILKQMKSALQSMQSAQNIHHTNN